MGCIDLRSFPQMSVAGGSPGGFGVFALDREFVDADYDLIARTVDEPIAPATRSRISSRLGREVTQSRLDRMLYELLTLRGDPTGDDFARPLMPTTKRQMNIRLDGLIFSRPFRHDQPEHAASMHQMREQYRANKLAESEGRLPPDHHRRVLDYTQKKLRIPWQFLVPSDLPNEPGPSPSETAVSDDFNRVDNDDPGSDWTEIDGDWDILSNQLRSNAGGSTFPSTLRHGTDLSGDDHYAQIDFNAASAAARFMGPCVRFEAAADTMYYGRVRETGSDSFIERLAAGTRTQITSDTGGGAPPLVVYLEIDGSDLDLRVDASSVSTATDTNITGNLRLGLAAHHAGTSDGDDFEGADLAAGGSVNLLQGLIGLPRRKVG